MKASVQLAEGITVVAQGEDVFVEMRDVSGKVSDVMGAGAPMSAGKPALVTAQRLYGDATRAEEIVARNRIAHPGFVPAGQPLEVLSDA